MDTGAPGTSATSFGGTSAGLRRESFADLRIKNCGPAPAFRGFLVDAAAIGDVIVLADQFGKAIVHERTRTKPQFLAPSPIGGLPRDHFFHTGRCEIFTPYWHQYSHRQGSTGAIGHAEIHRRPRSSALGGIPAFQWQTATVSYLSGLLSLSLGS